MLYQINKASVTLGGETIFSGLEMEIRGSEKIALVGPNGAGKTSLLRLLAGEIEADQDDSLQGPSIRKSGSITIGMLKQQPLEDTGETVEMHLLREYCISRGLEADRLLEDAARAFPIYEKERYQFETEYDRLFTGFGFSLEDKKRRMGEFSGGQQTRIALIRLLLMRPDLLLLDEPTNHLDLEAREWLEGYLSSYPGAVVMVSHDRFFLDQTAEVVYELRRGRLTRYPGNYSQYKEARRKKLQILRRRYQEQEEEVKRLTDLINKFKNKPRKASFARSRKQILDRMDRMEKPEDDDIMDHFPEILPEHPGSKWVWEAEKAVMGYDHPLHQITYRLRRGQKLGVIGPNGSGKSTFMKTMAGQLPLLGGKMTLGPGIDMAYFDQQTAALESDLSALDYYRQQFPGGSEKDVPILLGRYGFRGRDVMKKVTDLSGGEKTRLSLAMIMTARPNLLILDEPTNHLDTEGMERLEEILRSYRGTMVIVSHDRYFLQRTAEALLVFETDQQIMYYPFGYEHYRSRRNTDKDRQDLAAIRTAEEQALIDGLKSVPKGETHRFHEVSSQAGYDDWRFRLNREAMDEIHEKILADSLSVDLERYWLDENYAADRDHRMKLYQDEMTACCLEWYDLWLDRQTESEDE